MSRPEYRPPFLDRTVTLRNPDGSLTVGVYAHRRDQFPFSELAEGVVEVRASRSVFTVRYRSGVSPGVVIVESDGTEWQSLGTGKERGGWTGGMIERYLEFFCDRRSGRVTA